MKILNNLRTKAVFDRKKSILNLITVNECSRLLDLGCDDGSWTLELGLKLRTKNLYGVEVNETALSKARKNGIISKNCDLNKKIPFKDNFFDVIHSDQVIEHLSNTDNFIGEIKRVLKTGGYAIISTENLASWHNIFSLVFGWQPFSLTNISQKKFSLGNPLSFNVHRGMNRPEGWQHQRVFAYQGLIEIFKENGFKVEKIIGSGYYPFPNILSKIDKRHAAFLSIKVRKLM